MVLGMTPKRYKHFMRNLLTSFIEHEQIITTKAKAKHLSRAANKLIHFAKKAQIGFASPMNLIQGRLNTLKTRQKILLDIAPRLRNINQNFIKVSHLIKHRRGDNAPLVAVSIKGCQKEQQFKARRLQEIQASGKDVSPHRKRLLVQQKLYYEEMIKQKPEMESFFRSKIAKIEFQQWMGEKNRKEPYRLQALL